MKNIVILLSGRGSNFEAILRTARAENWEADGLRIAAVFSNRPDAKGLATARAEGLDAFAVDHKAFPTREAFEEELARQIEPYEPAVIVLAGFMRILTPGFVSRWEGKILNIHPRFCPSSRGLIRTAAALKRAAAFTARPCTSSPPCSTGARSSASPWCR